MTRFAFTFHLSISLSPNSCRLCFSSCQVPGNARDGMSQQGSDMAYLSPRLFCQDEPAPGTFSHLPFPQRTPLLLRWGIQGLVARLRQMVSNFATSWRSRNRAKGLPVTGLARFYLSISITYLLITTEMFPFNSCSLLHRREAIYLLCFIFTLRDTVCW